MILIKVFAENPVVRVLAQPAAILCRPKSLVQIAATRHQHAAFGFPGFFGNDVDHAVDRVGSPDCSPRAADDFDAFDVLQGKVQRVPQNPAKGRGVHRPPVQHHQEFVAETSVKPAGINGPGVGINLRHIESGNHAQQIGNVGGAGTRNVGRGDDENGGGCPRYFLLGLRD